MSISTSHAAGAFALALVLAGSVPLASAEPKYVQSVVASPASGSTFYRGEAISFVDASIANECPIIGWTWRFDDGAVSTDANTTHAFATLGEHSIAHHVTGSCGHTHAHGIRITIVNAPPMAALGVTAEAYDVTLDGRASTSMNGAIATYAFTLDGRSFPAQTSPTLTTRVAAPGEHNATLTVTDDVGAQSLPTTVTFVTTTGPLARILVHGPDALPAGDSATFTLRGEDTQGSIVALQQDALLFTAPTRAGPALVSYAEQGVTGGRNLTVTHAALASIGIDGPAQLRAGTEASYALAGSDAYANPVPLQRLALAVTAPTMPGTIDVTYAEQGVTGTKAVEIIADTLATITITGPGALVAGSHAEYGAQGADRHGNDVSLEQPRFAYHAPTVVGPSTVCHSEADVTGCMAIDVTHAPLATITLQGPSTMQAGTSATFLLDGRDGYGNSVPLAQADLTHTASTRVGSALVCYDESGISGCVPVRVVPGALDAILLTGPQTLVAGSNASYDLAGYDRYGNDVQLAALQLDLVAPTRAGPATVTYAEQEVTASIDITIIPAALSRITVDGPDPVVAGHDADYVLSGEDIYGNAVPLAQTILGWTAPTSTGPAFVSYHESGVTGTRMVNVTSEAIARLVITGPATVTAAEPTWFDAHGFDKYGNTIPAATGPFIFDPPTRVGEARVCRTHDDITGCTVAQIVPAKLSRILVDGPDVIVAGARAVYGLAGEDAYGNAVPLAAPSIDYAAPTRAGASEVTYEEHGIIGSRLVLVVADRLASIDISGPGSVVAGSVVTYALLGSDAYGNAVALQQEALVYDAPTLAGPATVTYAEDDIVGTRSILVVHAALAKIEVSAPAQMPAGSFSMLGAAGYDAYGNAVPLASMTFPFDAPTLVGPTYACYSEQDVTGCAAIDVEHAALFQIEVNGPASAPVASTRTFSATGTDAYGNDVRLAFPMFDVTMPTRSGPHEACTSDSGITGCASIDVVAGALTLVDVEGPDVLQVRESGSFTARGSDTYGNAVPLARPSFSWTAPDSPGASQACTDEAGVVGCKSVDVVAARLVRIVVTSPAVRTNIGHALALRAAGIDAFGQEVPDLAFAWSASAGTVTQVGSFEPTTVGTARIIAAVGQVKGDVYVQVTNWLVVSVNASGLSASAPITGSAPGVVRVTFADATPAAGAKVTIIIFRVTPLGDHEVARTMTTTSANGTASFSRAPTQSLVGDYRVDARVSLGQNVGAASRTYHVGP